MTDRRFDGASPEDRLFDRRRDATLLAAEPDGNAGDGDSAIAFVDEDGLGQVIGQDADLARPLPARCDRRRECPPCAHTNDHSFVVCGRHRHFDAEFARLTRLALGDALHLRCVQAVELVLMLRLLD